MATPNALFAIMNVSDAAAVEEKLRHISPWLQLKLEEGQWLLIAPTGTTTKEICGRVGIDTGDSNGLVVRVDTYYGRNPPSVWEWISTKQGADLGIAASA